MRWSTLQSVWLVVSNSVISANLATCQKLYYISSNCISDVIPPWWFLPFPGVGLGHMHVVYT